MANLKNVMDVKKRPLEAMESNYTKTRKTISKLIAENEKLHQSYCEDLKAMDLSIQEQLLGICNDNELMNLELQRKERELKIRSIKLHNREVAIGMERNKIAKEIKSSANDSLLQTKEKMVKLADCHKREMEKLQEKISHLEKQVNDGNQMLLLEMKHLVAQFRSYHHIEVHKKVADIVTSLNEKEEERKDLEILSQTLVSQDQKNNDELQDARDELIKGFKEVPNTQIGVRVRKLDNEPFYDELLKFNETGEEKGTASGLWSSWREYLRDPQLFKLMILAQKLDVQQAMDGKDERLKCLQRDLLGEVCKAATQINTEVLWNFSESRHATLLEGVSCLLKTWKDQKHKKIAWYFEFE